MVDINKRSASPKARRGKKKSGATGASPGTMAAATASSTQTTSRSGMYMGFAGVLVIVSFFLCAMAWSGSVNHHHNKNRHKKFNINNDLVDHRTTKRDSVQGHSSGESSTAEHNAPQQRFNSQKETDGEVTDEEEETAWTKATAKHIDSSSGDEDHHHQNGKGEDEEDTEEEDEDDEEDDDDDEDHDGPPTGYGKDMPPIQDTLVQNHEAKKGNSKSAYNPLTEDAEAKCRRDPTWRLRNGDIYDECKRLTKWTPRDTWWRLDHSRNDIVLEGHLDDIRKCLDKRIDAAYAQQRFPWTLCNEQARNASCHVPVTEISGYYKSAKEGEGVMFENAMTEQEAFALKQLQGCMHKYLPQDDPWWDYREFGEDNFDKEKKKGGNEVTFLQGMIQLYLPGIAATLYRNFRMAYEHGNWATQGFMNLGYPPPNSLGIRVAEALEYRDSGRLGTHADSESIFTIAFALREEDAYEGGHFRFASEHALFKVPRLGALSFFSESFHGVTKVTGGDRSIFVVELWESDDAPPGVPRCDPQMWFEHMQERWPVVTGVAKEYLTEELAHDESRKRRGQGGDKYGGGTATAEQ